MVMVVVELLTLTLTMIMSTTTRRRLDGWSVQDENNININNLIDFDKYGKFMATMCAVVFHSLIHTTRRWITTNEENAFTLSIILKHF